jgi:Zn-dependent metalloprotease
MKKFLLAFGAAALMSPAFAQHKHGQEYNKSVFRNQQSKRNAGAIERTNRIARENFPQWSINVDKANGSLRDIYGPGLSLAGSDNLQRAQNCLAGQLSALGINANEWVMYRNTQTDKGGWVDFEQVINNHKVVFSRIGFRFGSNGQLIRVQMRNYGNPPTNVTPAISSADALAAASQNLIGATISSSTADGDWVWFPVPSESGYELHPAWAFKISGTDLHKEEMQLQGYVDATNGEVLYRTNNVKFDYNLTVKGMVHVNGTSQPATLEPLPHLKLELQTNGGTHYTDSAGNFSNTGFSVPDITTIALEGRWASVRHTPQSNTVPSMTENVTVSGTTYIYPTVGIAQSRHINAYYHVNRVHDFMKSHYNGFTGLDSPLPTNVDVSGSCNAYYNGSSINFYQSGSGCNSFAEINDIVYHEYGHGINDKFYDQFGPSMNNGALNEGYADVWAMCITDHPVLGQNSTVGGGYIRRYDVDLKVYPADIVGEVHADGEIIAGAWWDTRQYIGNLDTMARIFAQTLYDTPDGPDGLEGEVYHAVLISALQADDDDNNINNGTPHFLQIVRGFGDHGIHLLNDAEIVHAEVDNQWENNVIPINISVNTTYQPFLKNVVLMYRDRANVNYTADTMTNTGGLNFSASIPAQTGTKIIDYYFVLLDTLSIPNAYGPTGFNPASVASKSNIPFQFGVQLLTQNFEYFENNLAGWTVADVPAIGSVGADNATTGKWIQAVPIQSSAGGLISQTGTDNTSGTGKCLVTGNASNSSQGVGSADVDNGRTSVLTPVINISNLENPIIEYHRWYSNNRGSNPGTERWEVKIGSPSTVFWPSVENTYVSDQSWRRRIFRVRDYIPDTYNEIQLRFIANDDVSNNGCVVEAALDDFVIFDRNWPTGVQGSPSPEKAAVYPNPANETVKVTLPAAGFSSGSISIYELTGRLVQQRELEPSKREYNLNTSELAAGTYFLMIQSEKIIQSQKLVIAH